MSREKQIELLINASKSNNSEDISNKQIDEIAKLICTYPQCIHYNIIGECANAECQIVDIAERLYNAGYRKQAWISVDERLPENDWGKHWKERKYYLVITAPSGLMSVATYGSKDFGWWVDRHSCVLDEKNYNRVTHWMPLPEPPKMKGGASNG